LLGPLPTFRVYRGHKDRAVTLVEVSQPHL
jgi:hypothetical protein